MNTLLLIVRLVLALVLLVAGLAKLADREGSREAVLGFGVPDALAGTVTTVLPIAELSAAVLLVPAATACAGAVIAAALLVSFCAGIARSIARGEAPDCHCFGQLHSSPAGPKTLARNLVLGAGAVFVVVGDPSTSATAWMGRLSGTGLVVLLAGIALAAVLGACAAFALSLLGQHGQLLLRVDALEEALEAHGIPLPSAAPEPGPAAAGLPVGAGAPEFEIPDLDGVQVTLRSLISGSTPVMLVFTDPGCGPCSALMPQIAAWQRDEAQRLRIALISRGGRDANLAHAREHGVADVLVQGDREVSERFGVQGTPSAVLIAADGTIASPARAGADAIKALVASQIAAPALAAPTLAVHHHEPQVGRPAPDITLRTLDGAESTLASAISGPTAVLFWNPSCGFCERMLPELRALEEAGPADAPGLVLVSTGDPAVNRQMGLSAPILLDQSFAAGSAFGAAGTPSAVLLNADRRIASPVAVGAEAVLALFGVRDALAA